MRIKEAESRACPRPIIADSQILFINVIPRRSSESFYFNVIVETSCVYRWHHLITGLEQEDPIKESSRF